MEIRRCQHIKGNGTQCGSPARRNEALCYFHRENQPTRVKVAGENGQATSEILVPLFEDAQSIQTVVRQVTILMLEGKIESKKAGRLLYALQIASTNLKRMVEEKPRAAQVVVDPETVGETPMGMTPWSESEQGHELEDYEERFQGPMAARLKRQIAEVLHLHECHQNSARRFARDLERWANIGPDTNLNELKHTLGAMAVWLEESAR